MNFKKITVCKQHEDIKAECLYCDLIQEGYWKEKYFETAKQLVEVVEELYQLEAEFKANELTSS